MQTSDNIAMLAGAMSVAQPAVKTAIMDSTNPFFKSKYADLGAVWDAIRDALKDNGLSVIQMPDNIDGRPSLSTMLLHSSGEWIKATYPLTVSSKDETSQGYGSALTYARRYGLSALMGVIADTDDDGNAASKAPKPSPAAINNARHQMPPPGSNPQYEQAPRTQPATAASEPVKKESLVEAWGRDAIDRVKAFKTRKESDEFETKAHLKIASIRPINHELHADIVKAIRDKHAELAE